MAKLQPEVYSQSFQKQKAVPVVQTLQRTRKYFVKCIAAIAALFLLSSACFSQAAPTADVQGDLKKYPGLLNELAQLLDKLQRNTQFPAPRAESRLLPLLPDSTVFYSAVANYGDIAQQTLKIFRQELQESAILRDWWQHSELAANGPKVEEAIDKFSQLHQYLGDEIVVSATMQSPAKMPSPAAMQAPEPTFVLVAEVRKPGLKKFLQQTVEDLAGKSKPGVRVLDLQEFAAAKDPGRAQELVVLVRPDFVVAGFDFPSLRTFNSRLDAKNRGFVSTPFGQRIVKSYEGGLSTIAAADLQKILTQLPPAATQDAQFQRSGFADMKYAVWEHKTLAGQDVSQAELSFNSPRRAYASWLAKPAPLHGLDFVSPQAMLAGTILLINPIQIFDDIKELSSPSNSNAFAAIPQMEQALHLSLKDDLLSQLGGEISAELDYPTATPQVPAWKAILSVNDAKRLQQTLGTLLAAANFAAEPREDGGVTYYSVRIPSAKPPVEITYVFADGFLIVSSTRDGAAEAIRLHRSGESLGKSKKFLASLPPGHSPEASALFYQEPTVMTAAKVRQLAPDLAETFLQFLKNSPPVVACLYGEEKAIREMSKSGGFDVGTGLIVAAIAIPNLIRSRIAANEASAVGSVRTVNTAQVTYSATYPEKGFAPDLATLGPDPHGPTVYSQDHAGLLSESLAGQNCAGDAWCTNSGYRFRVTAVCKRHICENFVVTATPVSDSTGARNFCSTSDGVIRVKIGAPLTSPVAVSECQSWPPL